jgi:hypothetical protein
LIEPATSHINPVMTSIASSMVMMPINAPRASTTGARRKPASLKP